MSRTGLEVFDKTLQATNHRLKLTLPRTDDLTDDLWPEGAVH